MAQNEPFEAETLGIVRLLAAIADAYDERRDDAAGPSVPDYVAVNIQIGLCGKARAILKSRER
jgi:hypothetical protein